MVHLVNIYKGGWVVLFTLFVENQGTKITGDNMCGVPFDWIVHTEISSYMECYGFFNTTIRFTQFSRVLKKNNNIIFFSGIDRKFYRNAKDIMVSKYAQIFIINIGN